MTFDAHRNFITTAVAEAPSPATTGVTMKVTAGFGKELPPAPFNLVVCPTKTAPTKANAEIIRVTKVTTDTLEGMVRKEESTTARTVLVGDSVYVGTTQKTFTDIETAINEINAIPVLNTTSQPFIFGVNGAQEQHAYWVGNNVLGDRGGPTEVSPKGLDIQYTATESKRKELVANVTERFTNGQTHPIVIINTNEFLGSTVNATYAAAALVIIKEVMVANPTTLFEIINEPWEKRKPPEGGNGNAKKYGEIVKATYEKVEEAVSKSELPSMPQLVVSVTGRYQKTSEATGEPEGYSNPEKGEGWIKDMFGGWPAGKEKINAYSCHPYGNVNIVYNGQHDGLYQAKAHHEALVDQGAVAANNMYLTEVGYTLDEATEAQQNERLKYAVEQAFSWYEEGWCQGIWIYNNAGGEEFGIYGRKAGTTFANFAKARKAPLLNSVGNNWPPTGIMNGPVLYFTPEANKAYIPHPKRMAWVQLTVKLKGSKAGKAVVELRNSGQESEGWIPVGKFAQEAADTTTRELYMPFFCPPGWEWKLKTEGEATAVQASYIFF